jgi:hypothetical protein
MIVREYRMSTVDDGALFLVRPSVVEPKTLSGTHDDRIRL